MFRRLFGFGSGDDVRAEPFGSADLVQVVALAGRVQVPPLAADASDAPRSWSETWGAVNQGTSEHVRDLRDQETIGTLLAFVNDRLSGWYDPWSGTPIATARVYFWKERRVVGMFGSGANFFSRGQFPAERIIRASADQISQFHRLAHLK